MKETHKYKFSGMKCCFIIRFEWLKLALIIVDSANVTVFTIDHFLLKINLTIVCCNCSIVNKITLFMLQSIA